MTALPPRPTRESIVASIKAVAEKNEGVPLGVRAFSATTGLKDDEWRGRYWARWSDALQEAGYSGNAMQGRFDSVDVLRRVACLARELGRVPSVPEMKMARREDGAFPSSKTVANHFGTKSALVEVLRKFCDENAGFESLLASLPEAIKNVEPGLDDRRNESSDGWVYLIQSGDHFKIGRSAEIERRVKEIRIALPEVAVLIHAIRTDDPGGIEAYWHRRFADRRANGEWFRLTRDDIAAFRRRKSQ